LRIIEPEQQQSAAAAADAVSSKCCGDTFFGVETKKYLAGKSADKTNDKTYRCTAKSNTLQNIEKTSLVSARVVIAASRSRHRARHTAPEEEGRETRGSRVKVQ
jgi:hypothetical protein